MTRNRRVTVIIAVHLLSSVEFFETPWTAAHQAPLSFTITQSSLKFMSVELVILSFAIISSSAAPFSFCLHSLPSSGSFPVSQFFASGGQSIGASASASILPMNIQGSFPLRLTGLISVQSKGHSRVSSSITIQKHLFFSIQSSLWSNSFQPT